MMEHFLCDPLAPCYNPHAHAQICIVHQTCPSNRTTISSKRVKQLIKGPRARKRPFANYASTPSLSLWSWNPPAAAVLCAFRPSRGHERRHSAGARRNLSLLNVDVSSRKVHPSTMMWNADPVFMFSVTWETDTYCTTDMCSFSHSPRREHRVESYCQTGALVYGVTLRDGKTVECIDYLWF